MKKLLVIALSVLAVAVAVMYAMGSRQPVDHVATVRAHFRVPADSLYAAIYDVKNYPRWRVDVKQVELLPSTNGHIVWREYSRSGKLDYDFTVVLPPNRLVASIVSKDAGFTGRWMYHFLPDTSGATLMIVEEGSVPNPFFRFAMRYVFGTHASLENFLGMLGKRFGEEVRTERVN